MSGLLPIFPLTAPYHHSRADSKSDEDKVSGRRLSDSMMRRLRIMEGRIEDCLFFIQSLFSRHQQEVYAILLGSTLVFRRSRAWATLFRECLSTRRARYHELLEYESPLNVRMSRIQSSVGLGNSSVNRNRKHVNAHTHTHTHTRNTCTFVRAPLTKKALRAV